MPTLNPRNLYIGNASAASVYTSSANVGDYAIVKVINFCNSNTSAAKTVSLNIFSNGGTPAANNLLISNIFVPPNDILQIDSAIVLNANSNIYIVHGGDITTTISGVEYK